MHQRNTLRAPAGQVGEYTELASGEEMKLQPWQDRMLHDRILIMRVLKVCGL